MTSPAKELERLRALDKARTKGEWFWSARTLRAEWQHTDDYTLVSDILKIDHDRCVYATDADREIIVSIPAMITLIEDLTSRLSTARAFIENAAYSGMTKDEALDACNLELEGECDE